MSSKIILKKSSVSSKVPLVTDLEYGELALNYADGALYYKRTDNSIRNLISAGGGASFEVGEVMLASSAPTTGTWLETGKYYSKAAYPDLAAKLGNVADFGEFATVPQAQLPQPFATSITANFNQICATDGTTSVVVGQSGAIRKTTDGINWAGVPSTTINQLNELRYLNNRFIAVGDTGTVVYSTDGTNWVNASTTSATNRLVSVAHGAGVYVVVGSAGSIFVSSDLIAWNNRSQATVQTFNRVIFANGIFVAVGGAGICYTSTDGITWTSRSAGSTTLNNVIYANGLFVAVGLTNSIYTSADGITWTLQTATATTFLPIVYANGLFVVGGSFGVIYTSPDGITWTSRPSGLLSLITSIVWNGANFVAVTGGTATGAGAYATSPDGITWTAYRDVSMGNFISVAVANGKTIAFGTTSSVILAGATRQEVMGSGTWEYTVAAQSTTNPRIVAYNGSSLYVAAGHSGTILTSPDGQTWTAINTGLTSNFDKIAYLNGNWIAMGGSGSGTNLLTSSDGVTWTARTAGTSVFNYAAYGAGVYVAVGASGSVFSSPDLVTWTIRSAGSNVFNDVIFANGVFVAVGATNSIYSSADGITWTLRSAAGTFNRVIYENSLFVAIANSGVIYTSPDGTTWTIRASNVASNLADVAWNGSLFVAVGASGVITTSPDGVTWTARTIGDTGLTLNSVSWSGARFVATTTTASTGVAIISTDGITWSRSATAYAGAILYSGYLGGRFLAVGANQIQTSTDGLNWVNCDHVKYVPTALSRTYKYGSMYYALSTTAGMYQSSDGITWSAARTAPLRPFIGMAYSGSAWVAVTGTSTGMPTSVYKSTDGTTWTKSADFGTLASTGTLPSVFIDVEYASGNFIIGCPTTPAQNITYTIYTSSDGVTWTGRLTPFLAAPTTSIGSDRSTVATNMGSFLCKSTDGGVTWSIVTSGGAIQTIYANGIWLYSNIFTTTDFVSYKSGVYNLNISHAIYSDGNYLTQFNGVTSNIKSHNADFMGQYQKIYSVNLGNVIQVNKPLIVRGTTALVASSRNEQREPNLLNECPLYSYDTATTFFVPPSSAGGGQTAYIYAGA